MTDLIEFDLADLLAESREYIKTNGWAKGEFRVTEDEYSEPDDQGECEIVNWEVVGFCAMGGVLYSQDIAEEECATDPRTRAVADALINAIDLNRSHSVKECTNDGECTCVINWVTTWNDADQTTYEMVDDAFLKAEKDARSGNVE